MPSANLLQSQPQLAAASVKGYRELLRRLRSEQAPQGAAEERAAGTLLQQAKARVLLYAQQKRRAGFEPLDPRRARLDLLSCRCVSFRSCMGRRPGKGLQSALAVLV